MNEFWLALLGMLGVLAGMVLALAALAGSVWLMIWPVERRARRIKETFRFRLIDLGCLLVYWQVLLAALVGLGRGNMEQVGGLLVCLGISGCLISGLTWWACVSVLSRAGIESSARRATFILASIPGAVAAAATLVISGAIAAVSHYHMLVEGPSGREFVPAVIFLADIPAIYLLRLVSLWIADDAHAA